MRKYSPPRNPRWLAAGAPSSADLAVALGVVAAGELGTGDLGCRGEDLGDFLRGEGELASTCAALEDLRVLGAFLAILGPSCDRGRCAGEAACQWLGLAPWVPFSLKRLSSVRWVR